MIVPKCKSPKYSLYYLGAEILKLLLAAGGKKKTSELFLVMREQHHISFSLFLLALDWLVLLGAIQRNTYNVVCMKKKKKQRECI